MAKSETDRIVQQEGHCAREALWAPQFQDRVWGKQGSTELFRDSAVRSPRPDGDFLGTCSASIHPARANRDDAGSARAVNQVVCVPRPARKLCQRSRRGIA